MGDSNQMLTIWLPLFIVFLVIVSQQKNTLYHNMKKKRKSRRLTAMGNEILKKFVGKQCLISTGSFGTGVVGKIVQISDNWIEVETKKGKLQLINADFVVDIKED